jgi:hypothetical protein
MDDGNVQGATAAQQRGRAFHDHTGGRLQPWRSEVVALEIDQQQEWPGLRGRGAIHGANE